MADAFKACAQTGCNGNSHRSAHGRRGWCPAHYGRWKKYGNPLAGSTSPGEPLAFLEQALVAETDDCIQWPFYKSKQGQARVMINGGSCLAARVVCERAHGAPPTPQHHAAHSCGKGHEGCINPKHLRWATPIENNADKLIHDTHQRGERHARAKLTEADVREIRRRSAEGETRVALGRRYNISPQAIGGIFRRDTWAWL